MKIVDISPKIILAEITRKLGLSNWYMRQKWMKDGMLNLLLRLLQGKSTRKVIRTVGPPSMEQVKSEEQAAIYAFNTLKHWFHFRVWDVNFSDREYYKYYFQRVSAEYNVVRAELQQLQWDYDKLRDINQKHIDECSTVRH